MRVFFLFLYLFRKYTGMSFRIRRLLVKGKRILNGMYIPFLGISVGKMFSIYGTGIFKNKLLKEASAISWSFFLSLFPFLLFLVSLLPYLPHYEKLQLYIFDILMPNILPNSILNQVTEYIQLNILPNTGTFSNFTIILALFFGTNGTQSLISGFNANSETQTGFVKEYLISLSITIAFVLLILLSIFGIYYSEIVQKLFTPQYNLSWFMENLSKIIGFVSFPFFYFILLSLFYWLGCLRMTGWKQAIPGALFTTLLFVLVTYAFAVYLKNFARYNVLYGSIGTIIITMIWVNVNIILILLGNELNLVIKKMRVNKIFNDEITRDFSEIRAIYKDTSHLHD